MLARYKRIAILVGTGVLSLSLLVLALQAGPNGVQTAPKPAAVAESCGCGCEGTSMAVPASMVQAAAGERTGVRPTTTLEVIPAATEQSCGCGCGGTTTSVVNPAAISATRIISGSGIPMPAAAAGVSRPAGLPQLAESVQQPALVTSGAKPQIGLAASTVAARPKSLEEIKQSALQAILNAEKKKETPSAATAVISEERSGVGGCGSGCCGDASAAGPPATAALVQSAARPQMLRPLQNSAALGGCGSGPQGGGCGSCGQISAPQTVGCGSGCCGEAAPASGRPLAPAVRPVAGSQNLVQSIKRPAAVAGNQPMAAPVRAALQPSGCGSSCCGDPALTPAVASPVARLAPPQAALQPPRQESPTVATLAVASPANASMAVAAANRERSAAAAGGCGCGCGAATSR
jgi:hypothetical protein